MSVITSIRNIRNEMKVNPGRKITAVLTTADEERIEILNEAKDYIIDLANIGNLEITKEVEKISEKVSTAITEKIEIILPLEGLIDLDKEIERLEKDIEEVKYEIKRAKGKLNNEGFVNNAPEHLVKEEEQKKEEYQEKLAGLKERLKELKA